jgi:hypothetical protein
LQVVFFRRIAAWPRKHFIFNLGNRGHARGEQIFATSLGQLFPDLAQSAVYELQEQEVTTYGDIVRMLVLPPGIALFFRRSNCLSVKC